MPLLANASVCIVWGGGEWLGVAVKTTDMYRLDEGVKGSGMGLFLIGGTGRRSCHKTRRMPAKCVYCVFVYYVWCTLFPPVAEICARLAAISVSTWQEGRMGQIVWFGWLSAISQLASRVEEGGGVGQLCLHIVTQPYTTWPRWREQGGGLRSLPLVKTRWVWQRDCNRSRHCPALTDAVQ